MENFVLPHIAVCGILYMPYFHNPESEQKILQTLQKKEMVILENSPWIR